MKYLLVVMIWNGAVWSSDEDGWDSRIQPSKIVCEERAKHIMKTKPNAVAYCTAMRGK